MRLAMMLLLCLFTAPVWAATRYVSPAGSDSNSCATALASGAKAKRTLNGTGGAIQCMLAGDTLILQDGTWNEQIGDTQGEAPGSKRPPSGLSWNQPTVIRAENPRKATINKPQASVDHVVMLGLPETQYLVLEGLVIDARGHGTCVWVGPSSHIRFKNNVIRNCGSHGVFGAVANDGSGGQDIQLDGNEIANVATEQGGPPGSHAIYFTGNNSLLRGNDIHGCPFYGVHATSEHGGVHSNIIENNRVRGCTNAGIYSQGHTTIIRNNLLEQNCIGIYLASGATLVANNTIFGTTPCSDSYGILDSSGGSTLANNLILQQQLYIYATKTTPQMATNLCDAPGCQLQATASAVIVDGGGGNLTLVAGGPAVNTGTPLAQVPTDRLGVPRPQGSASDIGAYEWTEGGTAPVPPSGVDTTAPTVVFTAPAPGSVSGVVTLDATATDNVAVVGLQYLLDGANLGAEQSQAPYKQEWDTSTTTPGPHMLSVSVRDAAGNFGHSAPVTVTVTQRAPPVAGSGMPLACVGMAAEGGTAFAVTCVPQPARR